MTPEFLLYTLVAVVWALGFGLGLIFGYFANSMLKTQRGIANG